MTIDSQTVTNSSTTTNPDFDVAKESTPKGAVQIVTQGFALPYYDYLSVSYPDSVTEIYTFKTDGASGSTVGTITIVYTSSTKANLSTVTRS